MCFSTAEGDVLPLYRDPHFIFRFAEDRLVGRFHLDGVESGTPVSVFALDPATGERREPIAEAVAGDGGWVDLSEPLVVRAGGGFVAVAGSPQSEENRERRTPTTCDRVRLRPVEAGDLPRMFEMQLDPDSNRMAVTNSRTREAFDAHWAKALDDPANTTRAVLRDGVMVGYISCFPMDGEDHVGYWIDRAYWGKGIASRALHLLLREVTKRPLVATAATSNGASLRVLQKCGFVVERVRHSPATDRYPECEETVLVLPAPVTFDAGGG